jgi:hypothetical protein
VVRRTGPVDRRRQTGLLIPPHFARRKHRHIRLVTCELFLNFASPALRLYHLRCRRRPHIKCSSSLDLSHIDTTRSTFSRLPPVQSNGVFDKGPEKPPKKHTVHMITIAATTARDDMLDTDSGAFAHTIFGQQEPGS